MDTKTQKEIINAYNKASNSLEDLARIYKVELDDVLHVTGNGGLATAEFMGDLITPEEADGPTKGAKVVKTNLSIN